MMSVNTLRSEKPTVFMTATSDVRSRWFIIIAFAVTSRIAKTTAMPIVPMRTFTFPHMLAKPDAKAFSVPVFVGAFELRN